MTCCDMKIHWFSEMVSEFPVVCMPEPSNMPISGFADLKSYFPDFWWRSLLHWLEQGPCRDCGRRPRSHLTLRPDVAAT